MAAANVVVLSTMLADQGIGEWGFSALVEARGHRVLVDTGNGPDTVINNARTLSVNLSGVEDVVLTHFHPDHVGGLLALRRALAADNPKAISRVHVCRGIFDQRRWKNVADVNPMIEMRSQYEATGGRFIEHAEGDYIAPGIWLTGPVRRRSQERNWDPDVERWTAKEFVPDDIPEDQSLVVDTPNGLVVVTGCGHAGIVNILTQACGRFSGRPVRALIGGLHLFSASDDIVDWTARELRRFGISHLLGAHCTGIESFFRLRAGLGLDRFSAAIAAVGSSFSTEEGLLPGKLAR